MNDVSPELLTLGITHDSSLALVLYLCWFIIMPEIKYVGALPFIILNMWPSYKKAFDSVPHIRLMRKIENCGIIGQVQRWIKSFLQGRRQRVRVGEAVSG